jgi:uncharacterized protein
LQQCPVTYSLFGLRDAMLKKCVICFATLFALGAAIPASAQNPDIMNMFTAIMGAAIVNNARMEWSRVAPTETACIDQQLRQQGASIDALVRNGIVPNDPRVAGVRFDCRTAALSPTNTPADQAHAVNNPAPTDISKLSAKPTFDCSHARSLTARTVCFDRAGASADWDLITAYWARYFSLQEGERQPFEKAQQDWLDALNQKCPRASNSPQCVLTAYHNRAASYRSQLGADALAESHLTPEQHAQIQQSLIAMGLLSDSPDGEFGPNTRVAIRQYKVQSQDEEGDFLTAEQRRKLLQTNLSGGAQVATPSFDCSRATAADERVICSNPRLAQLDRVVAAGYEYIVSHSGYAEASRLGRPLLQARQACGAAADCVEQRQLAAIKEYQTAGAPIAEPEGQTLGPTPSAPSETSAPPPQQTPPPPTPRIETARLKDARLFLEDTKQFIAQQNSVPSISDIAKEAATLQVTLNQFDERGTIESMQRLNDLLKRVSGFTEFEQQQQTKRSREEARQLAEGRSLAEQNEFFIDSYLRGHLGDATTQPLLGLRQEVESAVKTNTLLKISKANEAVATYVNSNGLETAYGESAKKFAAPEPTTPHTGLTLRDSLTERSKFLVEGPADEILLLYNASPTAPKVWKNVRGDVVFQDDAAFLCFAQASVELPIARYVEHYLGDLGAKRIDVVGPPCDLANAAKAIDIMAFQRGNLLKSREDYVLVLAKLLEADSFRQYKTITNYNEEVRSRQALSLRIESDLENSSRKGFGAISVTETPVACVVPPSRAAWSDGLEELLRKDADVIAPTLTADWQYVDTPSTDLAFRGLQRHQCGYVLADEVGLKTIMLALRNERIKYVLAPVWWTEKQVEQATFDAHDAVQQAILKKEDFAHEQRDEQALQEQRDKDKQNQKTEIERKLRAANGAKARGLMNYIQDLVSGLAQKRLVKDANLFPGYSRWLEGRFADQWEIFNVSSDVADFGQVQWQGRPLDAVVVKTIVHEKNRIIGKYEDRCYLFGFVNDDEFNMFRDAFALDCSDTNGLNKWRVGERFQSQWNAD